MKYSAPNIKTTPSETLFKYTERESNYEHCRFELIISLFCLFFNIISLGKNLCCVPAILCAICICVPQFQNFYFATKSPEDLLKKKHTNKHKRNKAAIRSLKSPCTETKGNDF